MIEIYITLYESEDGQIHTKCSGDNIGSERECDYTERLLELIYTACGEVGKELGYEDAERPVYVAKRTRIK